MTNDRGGQRKSRSTAILMKLPSTLAYLPVAVSVAAAAEKTLESALTDLGGEVRPVVRAYQGGRLAGESILPLRDGAVLDCGGAKWKLDVAASPVPQQPDATDCRLTWTVAEGEARESAVGVAFAFTNWSAGNFVFVPAAVYDGNRFDIKPMGYPPYWYNPQEWRLDMPTTMTQQPTLGKGNGASRIDLDTGNASTPLMAFQSPEKKLGWMVQTTQGSRLGNHALMIEENEGKTQAKFTIMAPSCRGAPAADWKAGDSLTIAFRTYAFPAPQRTDLLRRFLEIRKDFNPAARQETLPFSEAWRLLNALYQQDRWDERIGLYCLTKPGTGPTWNYIWQLGWCGGGQCTLPILAAGDAAARQRATRNLDVIFAKSQAASGFFNAYGNGEQFASFGFGSAFKHHECLTRSQGDWLYMAQRQFQQLATHGAAVPESWKTGLRKQADAFARLWEKRGQFGQFVDVETGDLCIGGSTCGSIVPGALALASRTFGNPTYLEIAKAAAHSYHRGYVLQGYTTGGPGEILSAPDSESAFGLFESLMALHEVTGSSEWLGYAADLLPICASWTVSYDFEFPKNSAMGRIDARSCGAVWASVPNKHGAPCICTWSGDSLLKYFRATGDRRALELLTDIAHGVTQYISRQDHKVGNLPPGGICERVNLSDWEGRHNIGGNIFGSCSWCETAAMLTVTQIPGLYVQTDTGIFVAFDNIRAERIRHENGRVALRLTNPTGFAADVKTLAETAEAARTPRAFLVSPDVRVVHLEPGASTEVEF